MTDNEGRRNPHLRLACARCQRRKIRCDGQYPTCSNCRKASAECVDGDSTRLRGGIKLIDRIDRTITTERTLITKLKRRVAWLESVVRQRLPDVDLSAAAFSDSRESMNNEESTTGASSPMLQDRPSHSAIELAPVQPSEIPDQRAHEIGLISVGFNADQKYIGPSSGYFLARLLLANSRKKGEPEHRPSRPMGVTQSNINDLVSALHGPLSLPQRNLVMNLCQIYFDTIQPQFPILHEPSFRAGLDRLYKNTEEGSSLEDDDPSFSFQVYMVLAISANISTWRTKRHIPGESYCLSALQHLDRINVGSSLSGLQCMILLLIFTMHSPHMQLNVWNLNYQCLAAVLDLGLQRQVTTSAGISLIEQEIRTRVFWTVFTMDRIIASMMGRPIGLRDEACELRLPQLLEDDDLTDELNNIGSQTCSMALSIHLCKLAKLNSEIKYVANSIVRSVPSYAYPPVRDLSAWQSSTLQQLDDWAASIPQVRPPNEFLRVSSELRCHTVKMLLLRPSPAIPTPSTAMLVKCHESARQSVRLYQYLYKEGLLNHDWITLHGVVLSTITILYCTRAVTQIAQKTDLENLMSDMSISLSILSATGEHWAGAKRARDILDDLGKSTTQWLKRTYQFRASRRKSNIEQPSVTLTQANAAEPVQDNDNLASEALPFSLPDQPFDSHISSDVLVDTMFFSELNPSRDPFGETANLDDIMRNLFEDFIPQLDNPY